MMTDLVSVQAQMTTVYVLLAFVGTCAVAFLLRMAEVRRVTVESRPRGCPCCGVNHPAHASYCRRCGRELH